MKLIYAFLLPFVLSGKNIPFQIGEILHYKASFANIKAARAQLKVIGIDTIDNTPAYHVQFNAKTVGIMNFIFPIKDKIDLWIDEESLIPLKIQIDIKEGQFHKQTDIYFPQGSNYLVSNNDTINISTQIHSPYSLFYFIRKSNFSIKNNNLINTIQNGKIIPLGLEINDNIKVTVPAGDFNCFSVVPARINNQKFKNNAQISMLFSDDVYRYPVKIWLNLKYGALVLELEKVIN